ncbi:14598_t:CDS:2 [Entrophospora sp. SA101]|nr:14598_t:CDS:2 [Entrophospora sp. SA101]
MYFLDKINKSSLYYEAGSMENILKTQGISTTTIPQETGNERNGEELSPPYNETVKETVNSNNNYPLDVTSYLTGIVLLSSGTANLFRGNKYKWFSIFIAGFYVTDVANPSSTLRFIYFILCTGIGSLVGMFFVCLWPTGRILVGAIGGFSLSMFALSTKTDGLFTNQIARYSWIGAFTINFAALAGLKNYYQYVAIISTVATGCYCLLLGTDIFVRAV